MTAARRLLDVSEIARMLDARADTLVRELLPDGKRHGHEWVARCPWHAHKNLGSFSVHIGGAKSGVWKEFGANETGDCLDLVSLTLFGGDKSKAILWSKRWLGLDTGDPNAIEKVRRATPTAEELTARDDKETQERRQLAFRLWLSAQPQVRDTPVDRYLRGRGVPLAELGRQPRAIRFHPALWHQPSGRKWPAMITHIAGRDDEFCAAHRTYLECCNDGTVRKAPVEFNKMTLGAFAGGSIHLWRGASGRKLRDAPDGETADITEGIEDGLSVAIARPAYRVLVAVSLSNLGGVTLPKQIRSVRLWKDNDDKKEALAAFDRAARAHLAAGREVWIPDIPKCVKDVNDLIRAGND